MWQFSLCDETPSAVPDCKSCWVFFALIIHLECLSPLFLFLPTCQPALPVFAAVHSLGGAVRSEERARNRGGGSEGGSEDSKISSANSTNNGEGRDRNKENCQLHLCASVFLECSSKMAATSRLLFRIETVLFLWTKTQNKTKKDFGLCCRPLLWRDSPFKNQSFTKHRKMQHWTQHKKKEQDKSLNLSFFCSFYTV